MSFQYKGFFGDWRVQPGYGNRYSSSRENGVGIIRAPLVLRQRMKGIWRLVAPLSFALSSAPVIFWQILRRRPETVFCVEPTLFAAPVAQLAARLVGAQTVLHVQDLEVDAAFAVGHLGARAWVKKLGYAFERSTLRGFDKVITISNRMAEKLLEKGISENKVSVIRNWVDLSHIYPLEEVSPYRAELGFSGGDFVVLYSGNIGAKQGLSVLLEAAERLKDEAHIHFVIAGEGPLKTDLLTRYGHLKNVRFLPFQPYARLNEFLNMPDLHVLPQERGAADLVLPSKLGGMLASGRPILVTADEGTELAGFLGDCVLRVPPGEAEALCVAIRSLPDRKTEAFQAGIALAQTLSKPKALGELFEASNR
ncbi:WcaI family glycosyltransferase [Neorhizobium sp. DT-125]|uniref:WcaI family glycosyltransferase n=1 Tax=Neorhizobium sp. DT-125 TaxID=3396163 RepID=UPI003F195B84